MQRWPETKRLLGLLVNSSGAAHARNARRLVQAARKQDRRLSAALLAAALAHTPEAQQVLDGARMRMARKPIALARELLRNFPKGKRRRGGRRRREEGRGRGGGHDGRQRDAERGLDRTTRRADGGGDEAQTPSRAASVSAGGRHRATEADARTRTTTSPTATRTSARARRSAVELNGAGGPRRRRGRPPRAGVHQQRAVVVDAVGHALAAVPAHLADPAARRARATPSSTVAGGAPSHSSSERSSAARTARLSASMPARASDVAISASSGGKLARRHVQPDAQHRPALLRAPLHEDPGDLAPVDQHVVRPLDRRLDGRRASQTRDRGRQRQRARPARAGPPTSAPPTRAARSSSRPWRPRPAVCSSAVTSVPWGAPAAASSLARSLVESVTRWWTRGEPIIAGAVAPRRPAHAELAAASPRFTASASVR